MLCSGRCGRWPLSVPAQSDVNQATSSVGHKKERTSSGKVDTPAATLLQLWAVWGWETSLSDWPLAWLPPWSRGCPSWMTRRSGSRVAGQTTCLAALSTVHLNKRQRQQNVNMFCYCWVFSKAWITLFDSFWSYSFKVSLYLEPLVVQFILGH